MSSWKILLQCSDFGSDKGATSAGCLCPRAGSEREAPPFLVSLLVPHRPDHFSHESPQVVTPASMRTDLLKLSRSGFTPDADILDGAQLTQKPSCSVQSFQCMHTRAVSTPRSFVWVGRSEINKNESITAGEARTEDSYHDELTTRERFLLLFFFLSTCQLKRFSSVKAHWSPTACQELCLVLDVKVTAVALPSGCPVSGGSRQIWEQVMAPRTACAGSLQKMWAVHVLLHREWDSHCSKEEKPWKVNTW